MLCECEFYVYYIFLNNVSRIQDIYVYTKQDIHKKFENLLINLNKS